MADSPLGPPAAPSRRGPPPIPRSPDSPPVLTDALPEPPPDSPPYSTIEELLGIVAQEVEAPSMDKRRAADLRARAGLLAWDGRGDLAQALGLIDKVEHPVLPALRLAAALETRDEALLAACLADAKKRNERSELADLGGLMLWRPDGAADAAELLKLGGDEGVARRLALAAAGSWSELATLVGEGKADEEALVEAAAIAEDRLDDLARARELYGRALERGGHSPYLVERLLDLADDPVPIYRRKLEALGPEPLERAATQFLLATALERGGGGEEAATLVGQVCAQPEAPFGPLLAWRANARLQALRGNWAQAAEAWEKLAAMSGASWSLAYVRRAAEIWDARANDRARAETLWAQLHAAAPADLTAALALARLRLHRGAVAEAAQALEAAGRALGERGAGALSLAARALEIQGGAAQPAVIARWREVAAAIAPDGPLRPSDRVALEALVRAYRRAGDRAQLVATYRRLGAAPAATPASSSYAFVSGDPRRGVAYLAVAGALALEAGSVDESEAAFAAAAEREPEDLLCQAGRAALYRRAQKWPELAAALRALIGLVRTKEAQSRLYGQLARVAAAELHDAKAAEECYEKALELAPDDVTTLHAFARLLSETGVWARAVELREQAVRAATGARAAALLCEVGEIHEKRLADDEAARKAYEGALAADERCAPARAALAALHRKYKRLPELLEVLRHELRLATDPADRDRQLELHLEIARAADQPTGGEIKAALGAYREALRLDPAHATALAGFERLCRREGEWEALAEVLRRAPRTLRTLRALCEALERLERWPELAEAREAELPLLDDGKEIARTARQLAELYERRLGDLDAAARAWHRVDEADPVDPQAARALQRIYEQRGRYADLAAAVERELQISEAGANQLEPARKLELWLKLGEIRKTRLGRPESAAEAYEHALGVDAHNSDALTALAEIYGTMKRADDLNRVLDLRAAATTDPQLRASVLQQKGDLLERAGDLDGALAAYAESFTLDPASRTCFTAYERVCYRREKWKQAMELYETAINLVEVQRSRAYRLADLYARRGQLQLQYLGQAGEAAASYLRVLELDPESDTAQTALERIFSAQSDWHGLIQAYQRRSDLVRDDAKRVEILRRAARVASAKLKDAAESAHLYGLLHAVDPTDAEGLDALERHYERTRDWERLIGVLTTRLSLTAGGDEAIALYLRIAHMCEDGLHDAERTIDAYRKILDIAPSQKDAIEALGRLYEGTERWAELVEISRRQIRIVTDRALKAILYFKCGSVMESKFGKEDDAIRYYDAAIKTSPSCLPAVHGLRDLYLRREDWPHVIQTLELEAKLWTEEKERAGVYAHIGQIYGDKLGEEERAIGYYEQALSVDRECLPANRALFELYFQRGEYQRALPVAVILTQKVQREGDPVERSEFYRKRSVVAAHTGDDHAAAESLVVALEIRPENMDALELLVSLCRRATDCYDFASTFRELEKLYRKRDAQPALARVLVAQGALRESEYDIEGAEQLYLEALKLAADEYLVAEALVALHERLRRFDAGASVLEAFIGRARDLGSRSAARYRLAELIGDGAMDSVRAAATLQELIEEDPHHPEAYFRLAQELYLLGRYPEAHRACERLIQLAAAPGHTVPPEELARYYDYLGRIAEASGDGAVAARAFRRAIDLDPAYPPAAVALARRAAAAGDGAAAQQVLDDALRAAETRGPEVELPLRRGIARFFAALGENARAIETYRGIIQRAPGPSAASHSQDDRVALADLLAHATDTLKQARDELLIVLSDDLRHVPAYRLLMQVYQRSGDHDRAARVATMLALLGYAEAGDRPSTFRANVKRGTLSDELRRTRLLPPPAAGPFTDALAAVREPLEQFYPPPALPAALPAAQIGDPAFKVCVVDSQRLLGINAEVYVAKDVPGGLLVLDLPRPSVFVEAALVDQPDGERRFVLGRALEPLRGGYGLMTRLRDAERAEVGQLLEQLLKPEAEREPRAQEFVRNLPRKSRAALDRLAAPGAPTVMSSSLDEWYAALALAADRAGLLACDDVGAAARMLAFLGGEDLARTGDSLGQVPGVAELVRFFLSDAYHDLRSTLGDPSGRA
jgi:tetratricopeptide (TPR) repeat protein